MKSVSLCVKRTVLALIFVVAFVLAPRILALFSPRLQRHLQERLPAWAVDAAPDLRFQTASDINVIDSDNSTNSIDYQ